MISLGMSLVYAHVLTISLIPTVKTFLNLFNAQEMIAKYDIKTMKGQIPFDELWLAANRDIDRLHHISRSAEYGLRLEMVPQWFLRRSLANSYSLSPLAVSSYQNKKANNDRSVY